VHARPGVAPARGPTSLGTPARTHSAQSEEESAGSLGPPESALGRSDALPSTELAMPPPLLDAWELRISSACVMPGKSRGGGWGGRGEEK
jgi:hypothetical protein